MPTSPRVQNSVVATKMGLSLSDYVVTEAGFAFHLGEEKFFDIKCGYSDYHQKRFVLVATLKTFEIVMAAPN